MSTMELNEPERWLIEFLRRETQEYPRSTCPSGAQHRSLAHLFLDRGRLFAPASPSAEGNECNPNWSAEKATSTASPSAGLYVEGWVWGLRRPLIHSWNGTSEGTVRAAACRSVARAYLGLPFTSDAVTLLGAEHGALLFHMDGTLTATAAQWLHDGIPECLLEDVGRPVPGGVEGLPELEWQ